MNKKTFFFALIGLIIIGGVFAYQNMGGWVRTQAQRIASDAAGVDVSIGGIDVSFREKTVQVNGIKVANPKGFEGAYAFELGNIRAVAETLSRDKIVLKEVVATGEIVNVEMDANKINLRELLKGIQERAKAKGGKPSEADAKAPQVIIKEFRIEQGELNSSLGLLGKKTANKLTVPTIKMYNVGQGKGQSNATEVAAKILQEILNKSIQTAAKQGLIEGNIKDVAKGFTDSVKGMKDSLIH